MPETGSLASIIAWLAGSASLNLLFLLLALISLFASVYFYLASRKEKSPVYLTKTFRLIKDDLSAIEHLAFTYREKKIQSLSLGKVAIWNRGRATINDTDIVQKDKLRIALTGEGELLGAKISYARREVNAITLSPQEDSVSVDFDFLDFLDGCVVDVYFTGASTVVVKGTIKGASAISEAKLDDTFLADRYLGSIIKLLPLPKMPEKGSPLRTLYIGVLTVLLLPIFVPLLLIGQLVTFLQRIPKQYSLSE